MMEYLITKGADVNERDEDKMTPLDLCAKRGNKWIQNMYVYVRCTEQRSVFCAFFDGVGSKKN